ncbi:MAG TPA: DUF86 domain-containing protein [Candidatus Limnocylindrales bacterium]|jgi:uncharacterized protein with HEPN domain|nr:DUF86 domain-containing protein [Candidatus Limnocylindrales bacterium]
MRLEAKKYLHDITRSAGLALQFVAAKAYLDYVSDPLLRSAVERQMQTVGEALAQLAKIDPDTAARITEHQKIIAFRNILVHGYANIDDRVVWGLLELKLPQLWREAEALLAEG